LGNTTADFCCDATDDTICVAMTQSPLSFG
jgi:hypothetical protein